MAKLDPRKSVIPKAKITLDENCGRTDRDFTSRKNFTNHVKTHSDEVFKCPKCPHIWKEGPENHFNTKKALLKHIFEYHKYHTLSQYTKVLDIPVVNVNIKQQILIMI